VRASYLPRDARWIDHSGLKHVLLVQTPGTPHARAHEELFWNRSLDDVLFFDQASGIDAFGHQQLKTDGRGHLILGGRPVRAPLAISNYAVRTRFRGARLVARGVDYQLWRPVGTPRLAFFIGGLYTDNWLAQAGHLTVWPAHGSRVRGALRLELSLPAHTERTVLQLAGPGVQKNIAVLPESHRTVVLRIDHRGPWTLNFHTNRPGYLADGRPISVKAAMPVLMSAR
jgi:hypothetical protein